ncbi:hypothetical protein FISHEDRAFT_40949 [Fistulina hepatica ATCC 64428]|uniref:PIPK domain-containing protein n=1 Tax=Fistulina hepatica ATCC 64428 TaxID=1128425 RepID=A0A0D7AEW3_9AGAR|nr:hypothetical protein FISHEDRAFT_40949 [Fistulina hepatica ATCC 64428]
MQRPLPSLPRDNTATSETLALSIDARVHRRRLIEHFFSEAHDATLEDSRDVWISSFQDALDELSNCITRDNWLPGIRVRHKLALAQTATSRTQAALNTSESHQKASIEPEDPVVIPTHQEKLGTALRQLRDITEHPAPPTPKSTAKHLLLCLDPVVNRAPVADEDPDFDILPATVGCAFRQGIFYLPGQTDRTSAVLYGLDEWQEPNSVRLVGGTFRLKGVTSSVQLHALTKLLKLAVYIHLSLLLEERFLANSGVPLSYPEPKPVTKAVSFPSSEAPRARTRSSLLPASLLSFLGKRNPFRTPNVLPVRLRRFSFISGDSRIKPKELPDTPFSVAFRAVQQDKAMLSASHGVVFSPPPLLARIADQEAKNPLRKLKAEERCGLSNITGWEGKEARGKGMTGVPGFVRHQGFSVLYATYVPGEQSEFTPCEQSRMVSYRYYRRDVTSASSQADWSLGDTVTSILSNGVLPCEHPGCKANRGEHKVHLVHGGIRIDVSFRETAGVHADSGERQDLFMWQSCAVCGAKTMPCRMSDGAFLMSYAKFLELLVYSSSLCTLTPALCKHTTPPPHPWDSLPLSRLNIMRHFSRTHPAPSAEYPPAAPAPVLTYSLSNVTDIYEVRVPRVQIIHRSNRQAQPIEEDLVTSSDERKVLRHEIKEFWQSISEHIDRLELLLDGNIPNASKALPRLPSDDDAYDDIDTLIPFPTTSVTSISGLPSFHGSPSDGYFPRPNANLMAVSPPADRPADPSVLLMNVRHSFQGLEQSLYVQVSHTHITCLNDARRSFQCTAQGAVKRLLAWQKKHLSLEDAKSLSKIDIKAPQWWDKGCHVPPGINFVLHEDDWGSIISYTLSTADYLQELWNMSAGRSLSASQSPSVPSSGDLSSSFFAAASGYKFLRSLRPQQQDPDDDETMWHEPEAYSSVISRKENPKDQIPLLSLREVLRHKAPDTPGSGIKFSSVGPATARPSAGTSRSAGFVPPSAWAKPDVKVTMLQATPVSGKEGGSLQSTDTEDLDELTESSQLAESFTSNAASIASQPTESPQLTTIAKAPSVGSVESDDTVGPADGAAKLPAAPAPIRHESCPTDSIPQTPTTQRNGFLSNTFASGFTNAMRYMLSGESTARPRSPLYRNHHGLLSTEALVIDDRPHIKYDWTIGTRLKFSCTVYYAKQFDLMRRKCGIDNTNFLKSMSESMDWTADGGKSKSNFWKTADNRFIIKSLVNAWNTADLQVLLDLAPSYFRYIDSTATKPSVIAKLLGFFTVEIRNLETGALQSHVDLLVMENIFYEQKIDKIFDLKGMQGRKVKAKAATQASKTLFDGEWVEGQQKTLTLVQPHSKAVLREAIRTDAEFLAKSNIMDYSLLLGVNTEQKQLVCALVDTIGVYTFAKTLEYKAKQGLATGGKDITVVPPAEYQERFVNAMDKYFVACPDKWWRPPDDKFAGDVDSLPSVL